MSKREIYDQHIAPLVEQIDKLALEHGMSLISLVQYGDKEFAASYSLNMSSSEILWSLYKQIDATLRWEANKK